MTLKNCADCRRADGEKREVELKLMSAWDEIREARGLLKRLFYEAPPSCDCPLGTPDLDGIAAIEHVDECPWLTLLILAEDKKWDRPDWAAPHVSQRPLERCAPGGMEMKFWAWIKYVVTPNVWPARWQDRLFRGHVSWGDPDGVGNGRGHSRVTIYGANAMHWAINVWTKRWGYICFHPTTRTFGGLWRWYFYISPDATPQAATLHWGHPHE